MTNIEMTIEAYISDKAQAWAPSTLRGEYHRLMGVRKMLNGNPDELWADIEQRLKPYSRLTLWTRVCDFWEFAQPGQANPYKQWRKKNARLFRHAYNAATPQVTFEEAATRIETLADEGIRNKARELLYGGLRYTESFTLRDGRVTGKGSKQRAVFVPEGTGARFMGNYRTFLRALAGINLKPHDLRKLAATELARQGLNEADLCKAMGWESFNTAKAYLAPMRDAQLADAFSRLRKVS